MVNHDHTNRDPAARDPRHAPAESAPGGPAQGGGDDLLAIARELAPEARAFAERMQELTGVDFTRLDQRELADRTGALITPWEHAIPFVGGLLSGLLVALVTWYVGFGLRGDGLLVELMALVAVLSGLIVGAGLGVTFVAWRALGLVDEIIVLGFRAADEVSSELRRVSPAALRAVPSLELARAGLWLAVLPAVDIVIRRRLKVRALGRIASAVLRGGVGRLVAAPGKGSAGRLPKPVAGVGAPPARPDLLVGETRGIVRGGPADGATPSGATLVHGDDVAGDQVADSGDAASGGAHSEGGLVRLERTLLRRTRRIQRWVLVPLVLVTGAGFAAVVLGGALMSWLLMGR